MRPLYSPDNEVELVLIESMLKGEGIPYFIHNNHFGNLNIGPKIDSYNAKTIMVPAVHYELAKKIIDDFVKTIKQSTKITRYSLFDKIRWIIEIFIMGWIVPGHRWKKKRRSQK